MERRLNINLGILIIKNHIVPFNLLAGGCQRKTIVIDKLVNNGFTHPIQALLYGGVTGFEELSSFRPFGKAYYFLDPNRSFDFDRNKMTLEIGATAGALPLRFVKKL